jgi:hypothetical protein
MRNVGQYEATMIRGRSVAPYYGCVSPPTPDWLDGPIGDKLASPTLAEHWPHLLPGLPVPNYWVPGNETAGSTAAADYGIASLSFAMTGVCTYQQSIAGSTLPWITVPQTSGAGFRVDTLTAASHDPSMPTLFVLDFRATTTGGDRTLFTFSPNVLLQLKITGVIQLFCTGSTLAVGTVDLRHATNRHRIVGYWDPGDGPNGGSILRVWTRHETVAVTAGTGFGGAIAPAGAGTFGVGGALTPPALTWRGLAVWNGWAARQAANIGGLRQGGRSILVASGATVLY